MSLQDTLQKAIVRVEPNPDGTYTFYVSMKVLFSTVMSSNQDTSKMKVNRVVVNSPYLSVYVDMTPMLSQEVMDLVDSFEGKFVISIAKVQKKVSIPVDFMQNGDDVLMLVRISNLELQGTVKSGGVGATTTGGDAW